MENYVISLHTDITILNIQIIIIALQNNMVRHKNNIMTLRNYLIRHNTILQSIKQRCVITKHHNKT